MRERLALANVIRSTPAETARLWRWRRAVLLCVVAWTVFVGLALGWLLRGNAEPSVWIVHEADSPQPPAAGRYRGWFSTRTDMDFRRVYPWVLLGPYVALVAASFPLERGRLRLGLPLNLAACVAFVAAAHAINAHTHLARGNVTIIQSGPVPVGQVTNTLQVQISQTALGSLLGEQMITSPATEEPALRALPGTPFGRRQDVADVSPTNLLVQRHPGLKPLPFPPGLPNPSVWSTLLDLLAYGAIVGLTHSVHFYRRFRERERRALFLESNLANARLNALRAQLHPHFLFNSLNAIAALLRRDPRLAEATLMSLSELLRLALSQSERPEVLLREEMQFVQRYLEIQQTRFGDKLRVEREIEPAALDCLVPTLLLQPLVENAIRHGIEPAEKAGLVRLTAQRREGRLVLRVEDDGVGLTNTAIALHEPETVVLRANTASVPAATSPSSAAREASRGGTGIGLANLRARLEALYGTAQMLDLVSRPEGGLAVRIEIPWRPVTPPQTLNHS